MKTNWVNLPGAPFTGRGPPVQSLRWVHVAKTGRLAEGVAAMSILNAAPASAGRRHLFGPWAFTVAATTVSTYALDAVATAAGVLLVASELLGGLGHWQSLVFLLATYAAWGAGLRASLRANWSLLERTGVSTNALSKAAHDIVLAWGRRKVEAP